MRLRRLSEISQNLRTRLLLLALVLCVSGGVVQAQPFVLTVQQAGSTVTVSNGSSTTIAAGAGGTAGTVTVTATYSGTGSAVINSAGLSGSGTFTILNPPTFPVNLSPGDKISLTVQYQPG